MKVVYVEIASIVLSIFAIAIYFNREASRVAGSSYWVPFESNQNASLPVDIVFAHPPRIEALTVLSTSHG